MFLAAQLRPKCQRRNVAWGYSQHKAKILSNPKAIAATADVAGDRRVANTTILCCALQSVSHKLSIIVIFRMCSVPEWKSQIVHVICVDCLCFLRALGTCLVPLPMDRAPNKC